jgi:hypothetical protein
LSIQNVYNSFISSNPAIKKRLKKKFESLTEKYEMEDMPSKEDKKKLLNKKTKRDKKVVEKEESEEEVEVEVKPKKNNGTVKEQNTTSISAAPKGKNVLQNGNGVANVDKKPFKRIDDSIKEYLPAILKDNSYENFMRTGDDYGKEANEKLKFTKGRDFKKEKTKFKNKTSHGGYTLSTTVRSIKLDDDDDE